MTFSKCRGRGVVGDVLVPASIALAGALAAVLAGCSRQAPPPVNVPPPPAPAATARAAWKDFAASFIESYFKSHPFFAVQAGRHEYDGQIADWSAEGLSYGGPPIPLVRKAMVGDSGSVF